MRVPAPAAIVAGGPVRKSPLTRNGAATGTRWVSEVAGRLHQLRKTNDAAGVEALGCLAVKVASFNETEIEIEIET